MINNMKKNLLSVLILALLIVNIVLTAIMMISVIGTNKKTGDLVTSIATVMNLELHPPGSDSEPNVPLSQTATYSMPKVLVGQLKPSVNADGKPGADQIVFEMSLAMNTEHKDYEDLGKAETLSGFEISIKEVAESVFRDYTEQDCRDNIEQIKAEILSAIQDLFQSDCIFRVSISVTTYQ